MKKVIIIGGGIAGLSAGVYARRSGFDVTILEQHTIPGGNSTSWKRDGYLFEGGLHWLVGSSAEAPLNRLWRETGALTSDTHIYNRDPFLTYLDGDQQICLYRDVNRLEQHLLSVSPQDTDSIRSLCKDIRKFGKMSMPVMDIKGVRVKHKSAPPLSMLFSMMSVMPRMKALSKISSAEYVAQFKHPGIRILLKNVVGSGEFAANSILFTLAGLSVGDAGYPKGGSLAMAQRMADCFTGLGGKIQYKKHAEQVVTKNGVVTGVLVDGEELATDAVIITADALSAVEHLFAVPFHEAWADKMRSVTKPVLNTFLSFGVETDLSGLPENYLFPLDETIDFAGQQVSFLGINNYANFEGYAPKGCTPLTSVLIAGDETYHYWEQARLDGTYTAKKQQLAEAVMDRLAKRFPQMQGKFVTWDVATPLTYERYCSTYKGSWMTIMEANKPQANYPLKSESLSGLYFAGQRMQAPGGVPVAVSTGRSAVQHLCKDTDTIFECET